MVFGFFYQDGVSVADVIIALCSTSLMTIESTENDQMDQSQVFLCARSLPRRRGGLCGDNFL